MPPAAGSRRHKIIQIQNWQAVKKPFLIKTICVHLNLLDPLIIIPSKFFIFPVAGLAIYRKTQGQRQ